MGVTSSNVQSDLYICGTHQITQFGFTIPCFLSHAPHGAIELAWFKETECICLYKNGQVIKGRGYENRVNLLPKQLKRGNVSLTLQGLKNSDVGDYTCQVTDVDKTKEITVRVGKELLLYKIHNMVNYKVVGALVMLLAVAIREAAVIVAILGIVVTALLSNVTFMEINRQWSQHERQKMERSALLAETQASLVERDTKIEDYCKNQLAALKIELQKEIRVLRADFQHQQAIQKIELQEEIKVLREDFKLQLATLNVKQQEDIKVLRDDFKLKLAIPKMELQEEIKVLREEIQRLKYIQSSNTPAKFYS
ncbi:uncharacterized protein [Paramisgurnus dabryanus]|uniref:uncharacterized protein n=1 Tax=Paramisgurnus dabryanus TaxID=90735 RepID=UPI003CCFD6F5